MNTTKLLLLLFSCLTTNTILAENLIDIYNLAKDHDSVIQAAYEEHNSKLETLPQARALMLPTVAATSTVTKLNRQSNNTTTKCNNWSNGIAITQPIFQLSNWSKISQANDDVKIAFANLADAQQTLLYRVSEQYFNILISKDNLKFAKASLEACSKQLEQTRQKFKVGLMAITNVHEAQAKHDSTLAQVIAAENELSNSHEKLREMIGQNIIYLSPLKEHFSLDKPIPENVEQWIKTASEKNWKLQAERHNLAKLKKQIRQYKSDNYPTLDLDASVYRTKNALTTTLPKYTDKSIGLSINIPIFSGGATFSKTKQAAYNYEKGLKDLEGLYRSIEGSTRKAYLGILTQISQITAFKQAVISNASALKSTQAAFNVGNRTVVDVLNAERELINAKKDYAMSRYNYILQSLKLKQVTGILSVEDLQEINSWLEVEK